MYDENGIIEELEEDNKEENQPKKEKFPKSENCFVTATKEERAEWVKKSAETRERNRKKQEDANAARDSIRYLLSLPPNAKLDEQLAEYGIAEEERTNMMAIILKQFTMAVKGNTKSFESLLRYAGYEPGESRRDEESKVRIAAIQGGQVDALSSGEEGNDVIIYLPEIEKIEEVAKEDKGLNEDYVESEEEINEEV